MRWFLNKKKILVSALWSTLSYDADAGFQQKLRGADESRGDEDYALMTTFDHTLRGAEENDEDYASMITFDRNLQFAKEFCWLPSATRGIGFIPQSCLEGYERIGLFCYKECPDEMQRWGFDCHSVCSDKFVDDGLFCRLPWYPTYFFFTQTDCESSHGSGNCEENCLAWYSKCPDGTTRQGCFDCIPNKPDCAALGLGDPVFDWSCTKFVEFGTPEIGTCPTGYGKCSSHGLLFLVIHVPILISVRQRSTLAFVIIHALMDTLELGLFAGHLHLQGHRVENNQSLVRGWLVEWYVIDVYIVDFHLSFL